MALDVRVVSDYALSLPLEERAELAGACLIAWSSEPILVSRRRGSSRLNGASGNWIPERLRQCRGASSKPRCVRR